MTIDSTAHSKLNSTAHLIALRAKYLQLINEQLPNKAKQADMPVRFNHCFARIVLDHVFEDCWYNPLSRKQPACRQLSKAQLEKAISVADSMLQSLELSVSLNRQSLEWRGKT